MKIRLKSDLPIEEKHGCTAGKIFDVIDKHHGRGHKVEFKGDAGEICVAFSREYDVIQSDDETPKNPLPINGEKPFP